MKHIRYHLNVLLKHNNIILLNVHTLNANPYRSFYCYLYCRVGINLEYFCMYKESLYMKNLNVRAAPQSYYF